MAKYVKVSSISCGAAQNLGGLDDRRAVQKIIAYLRERINQVLPDRPDLIVLPECCDRREDYIEPARVLQYYHERGDLVRDAMREIASANRCYIAYSAIRELPDGSFRNSTQLIDRQGQTLGIYNKNHLVIEEHTQLRTLFGKDAPVFECDFGRVGCVICFDLNFDELRLKYAQTRPDLLLFSSMYHGGLMQNYWAYSCQAHFVGAFSRRELQGVILNPLGEILAQSTNYFDFITTTINLDCVIAHLGGNFGKLTALKAKYGPAVTIHDPGRLGPVLISSEIPQTSANDMAKEFEIELLDDYFARSLAYRHTPGHIEP